MLSAPRTRVAATPSVSSHRELQRPRPLAWSRPLGTLAGKEEGAAAPGPAAAPAPSPAPPLASASPLWLLSRVRRTSSNTRDDA